ncbi:hypothetical protein CAPTEDRAFT_224884 [Capitella teleta]|uniref:Uncharacterized protein n=1 Tax=Capitella teleta TaxID=283909 RepID=R7TYD9_CAPTE|nr:hypothetical protein CAPTEDRAFT_224884 [Capitella teleta]|eukprot:ELT98754.1 hypothetical protein CAPTEDRAFT_224884 [Capitella teleta]
MAGRHLISLMSAWQDGSIEEKILAVRQRLHTTVYAQCFSPCGKYLVTANNFGFLAVFRESFTQTEVNCLKFVHNENGSQLLGGCGDHQVHMWDVESGSHVGTLEGHTNYIHDLAVRGNSNECISASEDGTVRIWDLRSRGQAQHVMQPNQHNLCVRPQYGKFITCVAVDKSDNLMVCGGGPRLCLWHLRQLAPTAQFDTPQATANTAMFLEDSVISAGTEPFVHHWSLNGDQRAKVPCTPSTVYSLATNKILSVAGNSHKIDICTNFRYKAFSMLVC